MEVAPYCLQNKFEKHNNYYDLSSKRKLKIDTLSLKSKVWEKSSSYFTLWYNLLNQNERVELTNLIDTSNLGQPHTWSIF